LVSLSGKRYCGKGFLAVLAVPGLIFPDSQNSAVAAVLFKNVNLFSQIIQTKNVKKIKQFFDVQVSEYWQKHYNFCKPTEKRQ